MDPFDPYSPLKFKIFYYSSGSAAFPLRYMALAIDTVDRRGLSNEVRRELLPKKSKVMLICHSLHGESCLTSCTLLTRWSALVLQVGMPCGLRSL